MAANNNYDYSATSGYSKYITPTAWDEFDGFQKNWLSSSPEQQALYGVTSSEWGDTDTTSFMDKLNNDYLKQASTPGEIGWNSGTLGAAGKVLGGIGSLANAWVGLQGVKLGKERLAAQDQQFGASFTNSATSYNDQVDKHNQWAAVNRNSTMYDKVQTDYKNIG
jgi:hypothetical protein